MNKTNQPKMTQKLRLDEPTAEETKAARDGLFAQLREVRDKRRAAVTTALPAMERLAKVLGQRSGQSYILRGLLYSLYNGQATSLLEVVGLDRGIREDFGAVLLSFGYEEPPPGVRFFYEELKAAITAAGQWEWFIAVHEGNGTEQVPLGRMTLASAAETAAFRAAMEAANHE